MLKRMADLKEAIKKGKRGNKQRAYLHYAIERFCSYSYEEDGIKINYGLENIGDLYTIYKQQKKYIQPTFDHYQGVREDSEGNENS